MKSINKIGKTIWPSMRFTYNLFRDDPPIVIPKEISSSPVWIILPFDERSSLGNPLKFSISAESYHTSNFLPAM